MNDKRNIFSRNIREIVLAFMIVLIAFAVQFRTGGLFFTVTQKAAP